MEVIPMNEAAKMIPHYAKKTMSYCNEQAVGIYVRLSDEDEEKENPGNESESIQNQKSMLLRHCMEMGWNVHDIYCDEDYIPVELAITIARMLKTAINITMITPNNICPNPIKSPPYFISA
jgi:hypothetical protein